MLKHEMLKRVTLNHPMMRRENKIAREGQCGQNISMLNTESRKRASNNDEEYVKVEGWNYPEESSIVKPPKVVGSSTVILMEEELRDEISANHEKDENHTNRNVDVEGQ